MRAAAQPALRAAGASAGARHRRRFGRPAIRPGGRLRAQRGGQLRGDRECGRRAAVRRNATVVAEPLAGTQHWSLLSCIHNVWYRRAWQYGSRGPLPGERLCLINTRSANATSCCRWPAFVGFLCTFGENKVPVSN